jgi:uroporphyrinogen-III decarboxylase
MGNARAIIQEAFAHRLPDRIPRGEVWLGPEVFARAGLADDLLGHLTLIERLGHDCLCLPFDRILSRHPVLEYRYFNAKELGKAVSLKGPFIMAIVDGPWQRLVDQRGLLPCLTAWQRDRDEVRAAYANEEKVSLALIRECLERDVDAVIIAEDLAHEHAPFFDVGETQTPFGPFYMEAIAHIHEGKAYALFHSCGKIVPFIPYLVSFGFDGLAAIQHCANDLIAIKEQYGGSLTIMAGIEGEMLVPGALSKAGREEFIRLVRALHSGGGFILCSGSGLYAGDFLERVQELYRIADEINKG